MVLITCLFKVILLDGTSTPNTFDGNELSFDGHYKFLN